MEKFKLLHVALYAKYWYQRGDIFEDLKRCLEKDGYTPWEKEDIVRLIVNYTQPFVTNRFELLNHISPKECWKVGYYTKNNVWVRTKNENETYPEYDYWTAVLYAHLSVLSILNGEYFETLCDMNGEKWQEKVYKIAKALPLRKDELIKKIGVKSPNN